MKLQTVCIIMFVFSHMGFSLDNAPAPFSPNEDTKTVVMQAYKHKDEAGRRAIEEYNRQNPVPLREWQGNFDYFATEKLKDGEFPWLQRSFNHNGVWVDQLDISNPDHAKILSDMVFDYILEGWFTPENKFNNDEQFRSNNVRTWCSTPWVVDGPGGRDAVHGLTRELALRPNPVYPADGKVLVEGLEYDDRPQGWGVPFFNKPICEQYQQVFGSASQPIVPPQFDRFQSPDGFVSFKLHFNSLPGWQQYEPFNGVYAWNAHVSDKPASNHRSIKSIPLVQIAVSLKDSRLKGTSADNDYWVMLAYTFDPNYLREYSTVSDLPLSLRRMKPMGISFGFETEKTILFGDSKTNYMRHDQFIGSGPEALLNGPADNAKSSCMGCHASGFTYMSEAIQKEFDASQFDGRGDTWKFTFYDSERFQMIRQKYGKGFDFNLQLESAWIRVQRWLEAKKQSQTQ